MVNPYLLIIIIQLPSRRPQDFSNGCDLGPKKKYCLAAAFLQNLPGALLTPQHFKKNYTDKVFSNNYDTDTFIEHMSINFIQTIVVLIMK